jgi:hypothetical protein
MPPLAGHVRTKARANLLLRFIIKENCSGGEGGTLMSDARVLVETVQFDSSGGRQIGSRTRTTSLLKDRRADIEAAVSEATGIIQDSAAKVENKAGWKVTSIEARFGLTLAAEAGVILSRMSAEASIEVTITIEHD